MTFVNREANREALFRHLGKVRCSKCGLFGCVCQLSLFDWVEVSVFVCDREIAPFNCPHRCSNQGKSCLDCFDYDKFRGCFKR